MTCQALHFIQCITPLHNGSGQGLGSIDRPIIREPATRYPFVQSSTLKGAYRALAEESGEDTDLVRAAFGNRKGDKAAIQGCLAFTDARLLAFPVRSLAGTFALATSRLALARLLDWAGGEDPLSAALKNLLDHSAPVDDREGRALGPSAWAAPEQPQPSPDERWDRCIRSVGNGNYVLEGLVLEHAPDPDGAGAKALAEVADRLAEGLYRGKDGFWRTWFRSRLLLVNGTDFQALTETCTQVEASTAINESGTAETGSLRYTEYLPSETVLVSLVQMEAPRVGGKSRKDVWELYLRLADRTVQFGGDETKGRGIAVCRAWELVPPAPGPTGTEEGGDHGVAA